MPNINGFGKPTPSINMPCPACGAGTLVSTFDASGDHRNRIACPVPSCSYDVPLKEFQLTLTEPMPGKCPDCGHGQMIRKTKDVDSKFMGWIKCAKNGCSYEDSFEAFKAIQ